MTRSGALDGKKSNKGIFITTSSYTKEAEYAAENATRKVVLIDGETLAQYMIDFNIGVTPVSFYEVKRVDADFFTEE